MTDLPPSASVPRWRRALGWAVHGYTASGLVLAAAVVQVLAQPDRAVDDYRFCFLLLVLGTLIDATDGTLARLVRAREAVPAVDGRRLSDLVAFLVTACLPLWLIDRAGLLPPGYGWVLLVALGASGYWFGQADRVAGGAYRGFPSCWNTVALYLYAMPVTGNAAVAIVLGLAVLMFVPSRYPHLTQPGGVNRLMLVLSVPWAVLVFLCVARHWTFAPPRGMIGMSAGYPTLYVAVAWGMSLWRDGKDG